MLLSEHNISIETLRLTMDESNSSNLSEGDHSHLEENNKKIEKIIDQKGEKQAIKIFSQVAKKFTPRKPAIPTNKMKVKTSPDDPEVSKTLIKKEIIDDMGNSFTQSSLSSQFNNFHIRIPMKSQENTSNSKVTVLDTEDDTSIKSCKTTCKSGDDGGVNR